MDALVLPILTIIVGFVSRYAWEAIQKVGGFIDQKLPVPVHGIAVLIIAFGLTKLSAVTGLGLPTELASMTQDTVGSLLSTLIALGYHALASKNKPSVVA